MKRFISEISNQFLEMNSKLVSVGALFTEEYYFYAKLGTPDMVPEFSIEEVAHIFTDFEELRGRFNGFSRALPKGW